MPLYAFERANGERFMEFMHLREYAAKVRDGKMRMADGSIVERVFDGYPVGGHQPGCWPMTSEAAGVSPEQIPEAMEHDRKMGVPTSYTKDGMAVYTDRRHRAKHLKAIGMVDRNGGYGD